MNILRFSERLQWRQWLEQHFDSETEVWLVFPLKAAGEAAISYNDAVEEALCFGWIDSTIKHIDALHRAQRFTPRHAGSGYSQANIERLRLMAEQGRLHPQISAQVRELIAAPFEFPADILEALRQDAAVWRNFECLPAGYKRIRVAYIDAARRRPAEFERRLASFIRHTRAGRMIAGFGGIDKYYYME